MGCSNFRNRYLPDALPEVEAAVATLSMSVHSQRQPIRLALQLLCDRSLSAHPHDKVIDDDACALTCFGYSLE